MVFKYETGDFLTWFSCWFYGYPPHLVPWDKNHFRQTSYERACNMQFEYETDDFWDWFSVGFLEKSLFPRTFLNAYILMSKSTQRNSARKLMIRGRCLFSRYCGDANYLAISASV